MADDPKIPKSPTTTPERAIDIQITQARNKFTKLSSEPAKTQEDAVKRLEALTEVIDLEFQKASLDGNLEGQAILSKLQPELVKMLKESRAKFKASVADADLALQKELTQKQRDILEKQSKDIFDLSLSGQKTTVSLLGLAKGVAALMKTFGMDTTEFMAACDDGINEAQSKVTKIDYASLGKPNQHMDGSLGDRQMAAGETSIPADLGKVAARTQSIFADSMVALGSSKVAKDAVAAPAAAAEAAYQAKAGQLIVKTDEAIASIGGTANADRIRKAIEKSAALDGDKATLSPKELYDLNAKLVTIAGKEGAEKIMAPIREHSIKFAAAAPALEFNK